MQYSHISKFFKIEDDKALSVLIKIAVFLVTCFFIINVLQNKNIHISTFIGNLLLFPHGNYIILLWVVLLLPANWGLEALKWQYLVNKNEKVSFVEAYNGILSGITMGFVTPNGIGDYAGRLLHLEKKNRMKNLGFILLTRISQLQITIFFGVISIASLLYSNKTGHASLLFWTAVFLVMLLFIFSCLMVFHNSIMRLFRTISFLKFFYPYFSSLKKISKKEIGRIMFYSLVRYVVFSTQFLLLFVFFGVTAEVGLICLGIAFIFMVKSIVPSFFELGVREAAALYYFSRFGQEGQVLAASLVLWLINIFVPTLFGLLSMWRIKIFVK